MILVINVCREDLHYFEFVKPIEDILENNKVGFFTKGFLDVTQRDLDKAKKIIICGTSLQDDFYLDNLSKFEWIKDFEKPLLGICAGMQVIGLSFKFRKLNKKTEIGFFKENFRKNFLGLEEERDVYHLHNFYYDFSKLKDFEIYAGEKIPQAIKHKTKEIYGTLFHPEVRNKNVVIEFCKLKN